MSKTDIEWADVVWNPVTGCTKISAGCKNCYAEGVAKRFWGTRKFTDVQCHTDRMNQPLRWQKPRRVFVNSMSDLFHEDVPDRFIVRVFDVMRRCRNHTFQILTKRPARMRDICQRLRFNGEATYLADGPEDKSYRLMGGNGCTGMPWVWLGVSVEDQKTTEERVPLLLETPAAVRWLSCEPLIGPVDLSPAFIDEDGELSNPEPSVHWVVAGGESGPKARPMDPAWAREIRDDCREAGVAFFMKQMSQANQKNHKDLPPDLQVQEYPDTV